MSSEDPFGGYSVRQKISLIGDIQYALLDHAEKFYATGWPNLYRRALSLYEALKDIMLYLQERLKVRVHKGVPYYMIGEVLLRLDKPEDALSEFLNAFTEDIISVKSEFRELDAPKAAEEGGAYRVLSSEEDKYYKVPKETLDRLKRKIEGLIDPESPPPRPEDTLEKALGQLSLTKSKGEENSIAKNFPSEKNWKMKPHHKHKWPDVDWPPRTKWVFLGGNYDNMVLIREVGKVIKECGFFPLIGFDFAMHPEQIYSFDLKLLEECPQAVFEVTMGDGHLMEIERALLLLKKKKERILKKCILIYQVRDIFETSPPTLTSMLTTAIPQPKIIGYKDFDDLKTKLCKLLSKNS